MPDDPNFEPIINLMNECFKNKSDFNTFVVGSFISILNKIEDRDSLNDKILRLVVEIHTRRKIDKLLEKIREKFPKIYEESKDKNLEFFQKYEAKLVKIPSQETQAINDLIKYLQSLSLNQLQPIYSLYRPKNALQIVNDTNEMLTQLNRILPSQKYRPLIQFVAKVQQKFPQLNQKLEKWLAQYRNLFGYAYFPTSSNSTLISVSPLPVNSSESSLLIAINQSELDYLKLQAWFWSSELCRPIQEPELIKIISNESDENKRYQKLSEKVTELINKTNELMRKVGSVDLKIELFLPTKLLKANDLYLDWIEIQRLNFSVKMCQQYPVIFRLAERLEVGYQDLMGDWRRKWRQAQSNNPVIVTYCPNIEVQLSQAQTIGITLDRVSHCEDFFRLICLKAIPIALWSRCELKKTSCCQEINRILNSPNVIRDFQQLPREIKNERIAAQTGIEHIGHHICLLWDDPERMPPNETQLEYSLSPL